MNGKRHCGIGTIYARTAGINQMLDTVMPATFKDVGKPDYVTVDVGERVLYGVAHTGLSREVDDTLRPMGIKDRFNGAAIGEIDAQVGVFMVLSVAGQPRFLYSRIVIVVVVIDAYDRIATLKQPQNECGANKASRASDKDFQDLRTVFLEMIKNLLIHG